MMASPPSSPSPDPERLLRRMDLDVRTEAHPTLEELEQLHLGELVAPQVERLHAHIARCPECADQMLELISFLEPSAPTSLSEDAIEDAWRNHRRQYRHRTATRVFSLSWPFEKSFGLAAASLLIALVGIGWWSFSLHTALRAPAAVDRVILRSSTMRGPSVPGTVLDVDARDVVLQLQPRTLVKPPTAEDSPGTYRLLLTDTSGLVRHEIRGQVGADPDIFLRLPRDGLPAGRYSIILFSDDHPEILWDTFKFEIPQR